MKISHLAFTSYLYGRFTNYDESYLAFLSATDNSLDLEIASHRQKLLIWLNQWGCRQFAREYHETASAEILSWYHKNANHLPGSNKNLWELNSREVELSGMAYESLSLVTASYRKGKENEFPITVGPTGASKILFALRPKAFAPWDDPIRKHLGYDNSKTSYLSYLGKVKAIVDEIKVSCKKHGYMLADLPVKLNRPNSTIPKLIDEYFWITITKGCPPPDSSTLKRWADWN